MRNKKADSVWQKLLNDEYFRYLIAETRKESSIPKNGFTNVEKQRIWLLRQLKDKKKYRIYYNNILDIMENNWGYKLTGMQHVVEEYLQFNRVKESTLFYVDNTECNIYFITPENIESTKKEINAGMYIKIGLLARPTDFDLFLEQNKPWMNAYQDVYSKINHLSKIKTKYKISKHSQRDSLIKTLNNLDLNKLKKLSGSLSSFKDIQISVILNKHGFRITNDNVRKIIGKK